MQEDNLLKDSLETLLAERATPAVVRAIEQGGDALSLWKDIEESGFCDAMLPESQGGAELGFGAIAPLIELCGRHALPVPLAQTMVARVLLSRAGHELPAGPVALASGAAGEAGIQVSYGAVAQHVLLQRGQKLLLLAARDAQRTQVDGESADAWLLWPQASLAAAPTIDAGNIDLRSIEALLFAGQLAGAMRQTFDMSLKYANDRNQFGRPISKLQAIQHQLSVMAEHTAAGIAAARLGFNAAGELPDPLACATAKSRCSEASALVAAGAHAVHGAIGITAEFDLQLYTRRLYAWRTAAGSETYWNTRIGRELLASPEAGFADFVRKRLFAVNA
ncbi:MAG: acyl-CoA dehydrogenase family protein [Burkholderiaceae bacterium]|nr:acyl-CoA dehydrogenase family protein [Burkholderiaceae bacterium]